MRFGILGSTLVVDDDQRPVALSGARLRALAAALACARGEPHRPGR
ncbi:hypothetical protein [Streptacidiphilus melanogenes]|nr:hypothetical protein [Streptacidiphilus melanogenes]